MGKHTLVIVELGIDQVEVEMMMMMVEGFGSEGWDSKVELFVGSLVDNCTKNNIDLVI